MKKNKVLKIVLIVLGALVLCWQQLFLACCSTSTVWQPVFLKPCRMPRRTAHRSP